MEIKIDDNVFMLFNELHIGLLICKDINNQYTDESFKQIDNKLSQIEEEITNKYEQADIEELTEIKIWKEAYTKFGSNPKKYKCSIESLLTIITSSKYEHKIRRINPLVDLYNYISLKYLLPAGGDDLSKVEQYIHLTLAEGTEKFIPLNSSAEEFAKNGEVIYRDSEEVLCRRWNWRECDKTKLNEKTKNACLVFEGLELFPDDVINNILDEMSGLVAIFCGGSAIKKVLNDSFTTFAFEI